LEQPGKLRSVKKKDSVRNIITTDHKPVAPIDREAQKSNASKGGGAPSPDAF
jgi:hypothetical protein